MENQAMGPNLQTPSPSEQPLTEAIPDAKEPDTAGAIEAQPKLTLPVTPVEVPPAIETIPAVPPSPVTVPVEPPVTTPLPSLADVVNTTTPSPVSVMAMGPAPAKKKTRLVLIIILAVVVLVAAGIIFYISTMK